MSTEKAQGADDLKIPSSRSADPGGEQPNTRRPARVGGEPIILLDMKKRDDDERQRLQNRRFELEQLERQLGQLPPALQAELNHIKGLLAQGVVDPLFLSVRNTIGSLNPPRVGDHDQGKLPSQQGNAPAPDLTENEKSLAAVFGILELDNLTNPQLKRFTPRISVALGEYTASAALFRNVLAIMLLEATARKIRADQWVAVVRALRAEGVAADDDLLALRTRTALARVDGATDGAPSSAISIDLPDLEEQSDVEIVADNLHAVQALYFASSLEELKLFQVVEKLVELFHIGMLPLGKGKAGDFLYHYWKRSIDRFTEAERRNLYARVFGFPGGDDTATTPNREFDSLWLRFISSVSSYVRQIQVDDLLRARVPAAVSQEQVRKAGRDIAANLSLHGYGIAYFAATELQQQIREIIDLLSDEEVKNAYGARDMWQVVDQVAAMELGGAKNSIRYRTMANSGAIIIRWLANRANLLAGASLVDVIDRRQILNPIPRPVNVKPTVDPTDYDLFNACEQWLAVNGVPDQEVEQYSQPYEAPVITSRPIQIPSIARDVLSAVGVQAGVTNGHRASYGR